MLKTYVVSNGLRFESLRTESVVDLLAFYLYMNPVIVIKYIGGGWKEKQRRGKGSSCISYSSSHHTFCLDSTSHLAAAEKQNPIFNEPIKCLEHQWAWGSLTFH